jgi:hypothetical protein
MRRSELSKLIKFLREQGVTEYTSADISLKLGPVPTPPPATKILRMAELVGQPQPVDTTAQLKKERSVMDLTEEELLFWSVPEVTNG